MPRVNPGESEQHYVSRCIPYVIREGTTDKPDQAAAICHSLWHQHQHHSKGTKDGVMSAVNQGLGGSFVPGASFGTQIGARRKLKKKSKKSGDYLGAQIGDGLFEKSGFFSKQIADDHFALDLNSESVDIADVVKTNSDRYSITIPFAASQGRDRIGDFFEVVGMDCTNHRRAPVAFLDHGRFVRLAIGKCQDPEGNYTVQIMPERGLAVAEIFLVKGDPLPGSIFLEALQVFELYQQKILKTGSVGYRIIEAKELPPDRELGLPRAKHLIRTELLEVTATCSPMNADCVAKALDGKWGGQPLSYGVKSLFEAYKPPNPIMSQGVSINIPLPDSNDIVMETKAMSIGTAQNNGEKSLRHEPTNAPHGAYFMAEIHDHLDSIHRMLRHHNLDNPKTAAWAEEMHPKIAELCGMVGHKFEEIYPDLEPIHTVEQERAHEEGAAEHEAERESDNKALSHEATREIKFKSRATTSKTDDAGMADQETPGSTAEPVGEKSHMMSKNMHTKCMKCMKSAAEHLDECAGMDGVSKVMKAAHSFHAKALHEAHTEVEAERQAEEERTREGEGEGEGKMTCADNPDPAKRKSIDASADINADEEALVMQTLTIIGKKLDRAEHELQTHIGD